MAYVDKSFSNGSGNGSDFGIITLDGLPSIPSNATLDSVVLTYNIKRTGGATYGGKGHVQIDRRQADGTIKGEEKIEVIGTLNKDTTYPVTFYLTPYVANNNGVLSYIENIVSVTIRGKHNYVYVGSQSNWTVSSINIRANYTIPTYTISTAASPAGSGSVSGGGTYNNHSSVKLIATPNTGYEFLYWQDNPNNTNPERTVTVTGNASYTAVFKVITRTITVKAGEGCSYISFDGGDVINSGETKSWELLYSSQFTLYSFPKEGYVFDHWNPSGDTRQNLPVTLTEDMSVEAVFKLRSHTVTFKNFDGTTLKTETLLYGSKPTPPADPSRPDTTQLIFTFAGWKDQRGNWWSSSYTITDDTVFTAQYAETRKYAVTWKNFDGTTLKTETLLYGSKPTPPADPSKPETAQFKYIFDGWTDQNGNWWSSSYTITDDTVFTAQYDDETQKYTVTWKNYDGGVIDTYTDVPYGTKPTYTGTTPTKPSDNVNDYYYTFAGWSPSTDEPIQGDKEFVAQFAITYIYYTVKWVNPGAEDDPLEVDEVRFETQPDYDEATNGIPVHPLQDKDPEYDYTFIGWSANVTNPAKPDTALEKVTGSIVYTAMYEKTKKTYAITIILDGPGVEYPTMLYEYGTDIELEPPKVIDGYQFVKWEDGNTDNPRYVKVIGEATYKAVYEKVKYTVTFLNSDSSEYTTITVEHGDTVTLPTAPEPPVSDQHVYTFVCWNMLNGSELTGDTVITESITCYPLYNLTPKKHVIRVILFEIETYDEVAYGDEYTFSAPEVEGYKFVGWKDGNTNNPRTVTVTGPATYEAVYEKLYVTITTKVNYPSVGAVTQSGSGTYGENETVTLTATITDKRYYVKDWLKNGVSLGTEENPLSIEATDNAEYTVVFELLSNVNIGIAGEYSNATVNVTGARHIETPNDSWTNIYARHGETVTVEVVPDEGYYFELWTDNMSDNHIRTIVFDESTHDTQFIAIVRRVPPTIKVDDKQIKGVYILPDANNPDTGTIIYFIDGPEPTVESVMDTVDGWHFKVSDGIPDGSHSLEKLFITDDKGDTIRIW